MNKISQSQLRIIGGVWRSRYLKFLTFPEIRPSPNRIRETLFNWLRPHIEGAHCLDLFAGSGILGFESVSRGAMQATIIEKDIRIYHQIKKEVQRFSSEQLKPVNTNAIDFVQSCQQSFDIIFIDPPFKAGLQTQILNLLIGNCTLVSNTGLIYVESDVPVTLPIGYDIFRQAKISSVYCTLLRYEQI